ncbi:hypothetical protein MUK42_19664 [Musa troglodytarum]|uniref:Uncharacterized protein n=1 Tax=Musa troglodytarum TaxID=320322 RepID=A0A9E7ELR3_9LILI|nr:hypothetical protein MUK42_19664 [Musa troglodytarum]
MPSPDLPPAVDLVGVEHDNGGTDAGEVTVVLAVEDVKCDRLWPPRAWPEGKTLKQKGHSCTLASILARESSSPSVRDRTGGIHAVGLRWLARWPPRAWYDRNAFLHVPHWCLLRPLRGGRERAAIRRPFISSSFPSNSSDALPAVQESRESIMRQRATSSSVVTSELSGSEGLCLALTALDDDGGGTGGLDGGEGGGELRVHEAEALPWVLPKAIGSFLGELFYLLLLHCFLHRAGTGG